MKRQLAGAVERDEARHRDEAPVARREAGPLPDLAEQDLVGILGQGRGDVPEGRAGGGLFVCFACQGCTSYDATRARCGRLPVGGADQPRENVAAVARRPQRGSVGNTLARYGRPKK